MDGGIAPYVCHHMTFKIMTAETHKTIYCSSVKSVRDLKYPNQCRTESDYVLLDKRNGNTICEHATKIED